MKFYTVLYLDGDCGGYSNSLKDIGLETFVSEKAAFNYIIKRLKEFMSEDDFKRVSRFPSTTNDGKKSTLVYDVEDDEELFQVVEHTVIV